MEGAKQNLAVVPWEEKRHALQSIKYSRGRLEILDQVKLSQQMEYVSIESVDDGFNAIKDMKVRGAPAIAIVGSLSLAVDLHTNEHWKSKTAEEFRSAIEVKFDHLVSARPTAVNLKKARNYIMGIVHTFIEDNKDDLNSEHLAHLDELRIIEEAEKMLGKDLADNKAVGEFGAEDILGRLGGDSDPKVSILTHCNTGSLATAGYGTALGVIRNLNEKARLEHAYYTETRPYNQGSRLTGFEMVHEKIPATLICDSMAGHLMLTRKIHAVVTGADRVTLNGDVANKIGTYSLAVLAKYHHIPFYVAMPTTSFDPHLKSGVEVRIEERPHSEMLEVCGVAVASPGVDCWNPAFDITPAHLVTGGIITEFGVFAPHDLLKAYECGWEV